MRGIWICILVLVFASCKSSRSSSDSASAYANYQEDLRASLPVYPDFTNERNAGSANDESTSVQAVNTQLQQVDQNLIQKNKSEPYFNGFTVLIYSGVNRENAFASERKLAELFPDLQAEMQYDQPRYLVKVGKFAHKIEAQKNFAMVKNDFPSARIIRDRFQRKEFTTPLDSEEDHVEGEN